MSDLAPMTVKIGAGIGGLVKGLSEADAKVSDFANKTIKQLDSVASNPAGIAGGLQTGLDNATPVFEGYTRRWAKLFRKQFMSVSTVISGAIDDGFKGVPDALSKVGSALVMTGGPAGVFFGALTMLGGGVVSLIDKLMNVPSAADQAFGQAAETAASASTAVEALTNTRRTFFRTEMESMRAYLQQRGQGEAASILLDPEVIRRRLRDALEFQRQYENLPSIRTLRVEANTAEARESILDSTRGLQDQLATLNMTVGAAERYNAIHRLMRQTGLSEADATAALSAQLREQAQARRELAAAERARTVRNEANNLIENSTQELRILEGRVGLLQQADMFQQDMTREEQQLQRLRARGLSDEQALTLQVMNDRIQTMRIWIAMLERGRSIAEGLQTPIERFDRSIRELDTLFANSAITEETYNRGVLQAVQQLERAQAANDRGAGAFMQEGSAAALSTIARFQRQQGAGAGQDRVAEIASTVREARAELLRIRQEAADTAREVRNLTVPTVARF